jgi:hypothetical protein
MNNVMPFGALGRVGAGRDDDQVALVAVGDEGLAAVEDPVAGAVAHRIRLQGGEIRPTPGLGHRDGADLLAGAMPGSQRCFCSSVPRSTM